MDKLSIIIPCFNEAEIIKQLYDTIYTYVKKYQYEIIFINDGSQDNTLKSIQSLTTQDNNIRYISFSRNFGKESAMLAGLTYANGDCVIIMDADLQHPPHLIDEMIFYYQKGYDQVIAKRNRVGDEKYKTLLAKWYYKLVNKWSDVELIDGIGDFRLLSKKAVQSILSLKEYNRFSKGLFSWIGFKQHIIHYENQERKAGKTKWTVKQLLNYGIQGVLSFNDRPLRLCFNIGLTCLMISLLYILWTFLMILKDGITVSGYFTTISSVLILGGIQLISIGVVGEYIGKIYYEVKQRPHYLIDETNIDEHQIK